MSTGSEIGEIFEQDIQRMTDEVVNRGGLMALYEDMDSLPVVFSVWPEEFIDLCEATRKVDLETAPASSEA